MRGDEQCRLMDDLGGGLLEKEEIHLLETVLIYSEGGHLQHSRRNPYTHAHSSKAHYDATTPTQLQPYFSNPNYPNYLPNPTQHSQKCQLQFFHMLT